MAEDPENYQPLGETASFGGKSEGNEVEVPVKKSCKERFEVLIYAACAVAGAVGQAVGLDLFIASFTNFEPDCKGAADSVTGPYFILLMCAVLFNVAFWAVVAVRACFKQPKSPRTWAYAKTCNHYKLIAIGVFDAMNGFLIVYSSPASRVPSDLQPILLQSTIPFSLVFSYFVLRKKYVPLQILGAVLVIGAIFLSLGPIFMDIAAGQANLSFASGIEWLFLFLLGCAPAALMNIFEEWIFMDTDGEFDIWVLLALESFYQASVVWLCQHHTLQHPHPQLVGWLPLTLLVCVFVCFGFVLV